jgi:hypothetical protein
MNGVKFKVGDRVKLRAETSEECLKKYSVLTPTPEQFAFVEEIDSEHREYLLRQDLPNRGNSDFDGPDEIGFDDGLRWMPFNDDRLEATENTMKLYLCVWELDIEGGVMIVRAESESDAAEIVKEQCYSDDAVKVLSTEELSPVGAAGLVRGGLEESRD